MNKKKLLVVKLANFLIAYAVVAIPTWGSKGFLGEPRLPARMQD